MPDLNNAELLNAPEKVNQVPQLNTVGDRLRLEANLLGGGVKDGFMDRLNQARENPGITALEFAGAAALGAGLTAMKSAGGRWEKAAAIAGEGLKWVAIGDAARRVVPSAYAAVDTMINPQNYLENRAIVAQYLGGAAFDYPLMMAGGYAGSAAVNYGPRALSSMTERFKSRASEPVTIPNADVLAKVGEIKFPTNTPGDLSAKLANGQFAANPAKTLAEASAARSAPNLKLPELKITDGKPVLEMPAKTIKPTDFNPYEFKPLDALMVKPKLDFSIKPMVTTRMTVFPIIPLPTTDSVVLQLKKAKE